MMKYLSLVQPSPTLYAEFVAALAAPPLYQLSGLLFFPLYGEPKSTAIRFADPPFTNYSGGDACAGFVTLSVLLAGPYAPSDGSCGYSAEISPS
jgi:hypothetical protein